jgi:hypothetical protein
LGVTDYSGPGTPFSYVSYSRTSWRACNILLICLVFAHYDTVSSFLLLPTVVPTDSSWILAGDLNSHSPSWGYDDFNKKGEEVENWIITNRLNLINQPDDPPTYYSRSWRTTSSPDLAIATDDIESISSREVCQQLGGSDHKPVIIRIGRKMRSMVDNLQPSWNYKRVNWELFAQTTDERCSNIDLSERSVTKNVRMFNASILDAAKRAILRGRRRVYKPLWNKDLENLHQKVSDARDVMEATPTDTNVIAHNQAKAVYTRAMVESIRKSWQEKTETLNLEKDSKKLWNLTRSLNEESP